MVRLNSDEQEGEALRRPTHSLSDSELGGRGGDEAAGSSRPADDWWRQLTPRGLVAGAALGGVFCVVVHKLMLTVGLFPTFNTSAGLLSFVSLKSWQAVTQRLGWFTGSPALSAQETTVVQTFVIACCNLAFSGGFGLQLGALSSSTWASMNVPDPLPGDSIEETSEPTFWRSVALLACVSVIGVFTVVFLRKTFIIDYQLPYPSGAATGILINGFFTSVGEAAAARQIGTMLLWLSISFAWGAFKWLFSGSACAMCTTPGARCGGFTSFPTFGLAALKWKWNFDFALNLVGTGMICSHAVNWSIMLGAAISWGFLWPLIDSKRGDWYPANTDESSMQGLYGYKIFITLAIFMSDGIYNIAKVLVLSCIDISQRSEAAARRAHALTASDVSSSGINREKSSSSGDGGGGGLPGAARAGDETDGLVTRVGAAGLADLDDEASEPEEKFATAHETPSERTERTRVFLADRFPPWLSAGGYFGLCVVGSIVIPLLYANKIKWYMVTVAYLLALVMAIPNAYGDGLTDWDMASMYGKFGVLVFAAWGGADGGITAGLVSCSVLLVATSTAAHLMQDFRTGYLTLTSPKAMFVSQVVGALMGVVLAPATFQLFWRTGLVGASDGPYPTPLAKVYRAMAVVASQGVSGALPPHCGPLVLAFFIGTLALNIARDAAPAKWRHYMPVPMAIGIPFYLGAYLAVDMCVGSAANLIWAYVNPKGHAELGMAVAAGMLVGDGVWTVPASLLVIAGVRPPMCMAYAPGG